MSDTSNNGPQHVLVLDNEDAKKLRVALHAGRVALRDGLLKGDGNPTPVERVYIQETIELIEGLITDMDDELGRIPWPDDEGNGPERPIRG